MLLTVDEEQRTITLSKIQICLDKITLMSCRWIILNRDELKITRSLVIKISSTKVKDGMLYKEKEPINIKYGNN